MQLVQMLGQCCQYVNNKLSGSTNKLFTLNNQPSGSLAIHSCFSNFVANM